MSHYVDIITEIMNQDMLVKALIRMGFTREQIEISDISQTLCDWMGNKTNKHAHIIISKEHIGKYSNDFGFEKMSDGRYKAHIDEGNEYGEEWQNKLYTYYNVEVAKSEYETRGIHCTEETDEKQRIVLKAYV